MGKMYYGELEVYFEANPQMEQSIKDEKTDMAAVSWAVNRLGELGKTFEMQDLIRYVQKLRSK